MTRSPLVLVLLSVLPLVGCSSVEKPALSVSGPSMVDVTPDGRVLVFELTASNPNDEELPLIDVRYRASAGGRTLFRGTRSAQASAPRDGVSTIRLPVPVPAAVPVEGPVQLSGTLIYRRSGRLSKTFADFGLHRSESFSHTGELPIDD